MANEPLLLILDVDTGVDDCVALLYALAAPDVELVAVTCCAGNVTEPQAAANTLAVLELGGAGHVEVAPGSSVRSSPRCARPRVTARRAWAMQRCRRRERSCRHDLGPTCSSRRPAAVPAKSCSSPPGR